MACVSYAQNTPLLLVLMPLILHFTVNRSHGMACGGISTALMLLQRLSPDVRDAARLLFVVGGSQ